MPEYSMTPVQPLDGFHHEFDGVTLAEMSGHSLVSIATPLGGDKALEKSLSSAYKAKRPAVGGSTVSELDNSRFLDCSATSCLCCLIIQVPARRELLPAGWVRPVTTLTSRTAGPF